MPTLTQPPAEPPPGDAPPGDAPQVDRAVDEPKVDKSSPKVQRMFGQIAGRYDLLNRVMTGGIDVVWRRRTVREAAPATGGPLAGKPILDVCCGTGDLTLDYRRAAPDGTLVVGTDFTPEMLAVTDRKQPPGGLPVPYALADTLALPFAEATFQVVSVAFGLRNVSDTLAGLVEMARVTAPGGTVAILECSRPTNWLVRRVFPLHFRVVVPLVGQLLNRNASDAYRYLPNSVAEFPSGEELAALMRQAGLIDVRFVPLTFGTVTLYLGKRA